MDNTLYKNNIYMNIHCTCINYIFRKPCETTYISSKLKLIN